MTEKLKKKEETEGTEEVSETTPPTADSTRKIVVEHVFRDERVVKPEKPSTETPSKEPKVPDGKTVIEKPEKPVTEIPPAETPPQSPEKKGEKPTPTVDDMAKLQKEKKDVETQLEEKNAMLASLALKDFEDQKTALVATVKDEKKKKAVEDFIGTDSAKLEQVKFMTGLLGQALAEGGVEVEGAEGAGIKIPKPTGEEGEETNEDGTEAVPPKGKARKAPAKSVPDVSGRAIIDDLYNILSDPTKTKAEKDIAEGKINELYSQFTKGSKDAGKIVKIKVLDCPQCHNTMEGDTCQHCGYTLPQWEQKPPSLR